VGPDTIYKPGDLIMVKAELGLHRQDLLSRSRARVDKNWKRSSVLCVISHFVQTGGSILVRFKASHALYARRRLSIGSATQ
jgi:hypothetical protein